jgi:hypothetical protein
LASLAMGGCHAQADDQAALRPTSERSQGNDAGNAAMKARVGELEGRVVRLEDDIRFLLKHDEANAKDISAISRDIADMSREQVEQLERRKAGNGE